MHSHTQSPWPAANSRRSRSPGAGRWCLSPRMYSPPRQPPVAFEPCGVFRPHAGKLGLVGFSHVGMAGLEPAASRPQPRALPTAPHSETVAILPRSRSPDGPKRRMAASHAGRDSNPDQRFWRPPCLPLHHRRKGRRPPRHARRRPALRTEDAIDASREPRAGFEPATCRLRGGCATTGPSGP